MPFQAFESLQLPKFELHYRSAALSARAIRLEIAFTAAFSVAQKKRFYLMEIKQSVRVLWFGLVAF